MVAHENGGKQIFRPFAPDTLKINVLICTGFTSENFAFKLPSFTSVCVTDLSRRR